MGIIKALIIIFTIILVILVLITLAVYLMEKNNKDKILDNNNTKYSDELLLLIKKEKDYDELLEIEYSNDGNSLSNIDKITINIKDKILIHEESPTHNDPISVVEYSISDKDIKNLLKQIEEYNFPMWEDIEEYNEIQALDGASERIQFTYDNSINGGPEMDWYTFDFDKELPDDAKEALYDFVDSIQKLTKEKNIIKEYTEERE